MRLQPRSFHTIKFFWNFPISLNSFSFIFVSTLLSSSETLLCSIVQELVLLSFHTIKFFWNSVNASYRSCSVSGFHTIKFFWNIFRFISLMSLTPRFHTIKFFWNLGLLRYVRYPKSVSTLLSSSETCITIKYPLIGHSSFHTIKFFWNMFEYDAFRAGAKMFPHY